MTKAVIDEFEIVEIEEQDGTQAIGFRIETQGATKLFFEEQAIGKPVRTSRTFASVTSASEPASRNGRPAESICRTPVHSIQR